MILVPVPQEPPLRGRSFPRGVRSFLPDGGLLPEASVPKTPKIESTHMLCYLAIMQICRYVIVG